MLFYVNIPTNKLRIAFLWEGVQNYRFRLTDGLGEALKVLKDRGHTIGYFEPDDEIGIIGFRPDVLLNWGPLCANTTPKVISYPYKKAIAFGGGPIDKDNVHGFDLYFTESEVNELEFESFGKPWMRAFGINEKVFAPKELVKVYDAAFFGTFAKWKRPELFAKAVGEKGVAVGIHQEHEKECYEVCKAEGVTVIDEAPREALADLMNQSHTVVNPAEYWGGGQRLTLEAMSCNVPPIVMSDAPKNTEYVEESGFGLVCDPNPEAIREAIREAKNIPPTNLGRDYILSKFTIKHYADALEQGLMSL
jgi:glycosyltransferase involved in cell wall biosynthesis